MKVSELETWARSLANLARSAAISHDDVDSSSNMVWKDIYARLLERDDDYWTTDATFSTLTTYATTNPNEYMIPLPADFYKLRAVDYLPGSSGKWREMHKFPMSMRNDEPAEPHYRFNDTNLWVVGVNLSQVRIRYYPPPATFTHPDADLVYGTSVTPNNFNLISSPAYATWKNTLIYVYNSQNIKEESIDSNSTAAPVTLLAAGLTVQNLMYYKGYLYWYQPAAGIIRRAPTDLVTAPIVPATVVAVATSLGGIYKDKLYYTAGGQMFNSALDGTGAALLLAAAGTWLSLAGGIVFYIDGAAALKAIGGGTLIASGVSACTSDGTNLYILDTLGQVRKLTLTGAALATDTVIRTDVTAIGQWYGNRIPTITGETQKLIAASSYVDYDVNYPSNIPVEIVAVQMAIDFCTKLGKDFTALKLRLGDPDIVPPTGLWASFKKLAKRDDYEPERIKNSRSMGTGLGMM